MQSNILDDSFVLISLQTDLLKFTLHMVRLIGDITTQEEKLPGAIDEVGGRKKRKEKGNKRKE